LNIALTTIGSTGDLQPFLALSLALQKAGHRVRVCSHDFFAPRFAKAGIDFAPVGAPFEEARWLRVWDRLDRAGNNILLQVETLIDELFLHEARRHYDDCVTAMRGFDLAICHHGDLFGQEAALRLGMPWAGVILCPGVIRTPGNPPLHAPNLGRAGNRLLWAVGDLVMRRGQKRIDAALRSVESRRPGLGVTSSHSPDLNLIAASPVLGRMPPDLPPHFLATGYWFIDEPAFEPPADLAAFLAAGPPPTVVSFGSMGGRGGDETARMLVEAGRLAGQRLVIQKGFGNIFIEEEAALSERVFFAEFTPHDYLFKQAACVVHHGGAGTTAAATRAGKPSIVVPHLADQYYWADCLRRRGIAPRSLPRTRLTPERLAKRMVGVAASQQMRERAAALGQQLRVENGLGQAVAAIEALGRKSGLPLLSDEAAPSAAQLGAPFVPR
jgi:sterol 3beta-glucosyltransferase